MGFRVVHLTDRAVFIRTGGVEVAKTYVAQTVSRPIGLQRLFENQFGNPVGIHRDAWQIFGDRHLRRHSVNSATGRKHELAHVGVEQGVQHGQPVQHIVLKILSGIHHRFAHIRVGGEVHHRVDPAQHLAQLGLV